jgi:hypothetical protein
MSGVPDDSVKDRDAASPYASAKRLFVAATIAIAAGLGVAGTASRDAGGALVLGGWLLGLWALHRLGRAGSTRPASESPRA